MFGFGFIHLGLAAAAVPIGAAVVLVHLLRSRGGRPIRWAAMQFLQAAEAQSRRRLRLERWLLIALRTAMLVLLAMVLARPLLGTAGLLDAGRRGALLVVLDNGLAMQAASGGAAQGPRSLFAGAVEAVGPILRDWRGPVGIVPALGRDPADPSWFERPDLAEAALNRIVPTAGRADWPVLLAALPELLGGSNVPADRRTVLVLTSLTRGNWVDEDRWAAALAALRDAAARIVLLDLAPASRENVAVADLHVEALLAGGDLPCLARASVANYGPATAAGLSVVWTVDGREVRQDELPLIPSGATHDLPAELPAPSVGPHTVQVRLAGVNDALPADDQRWAQVDSARPLRVLIVEPNVAGATAEQASLFVAAALRSAARQAAAPVQVDLIGPADLRAALAEPADAVVLCDVFGLTAGDWGRLAEHGRCGGGLIVWLGARADLAAYRTAEASALLPAVPEAVVTAPGEDGWPIGVAAPAPVVLADLLDRSAGPDAASLGVVRRLVGVRPAGGSRALAQTATGLPVILSRKMERGRSVLVCTSPDLAWSNLASRAAFPALVLDLLREALGAWSADGQAPCGRPLRVFLPTAAIRSARWLKPDGGSVAVELALDDGRAQAVLPLADQPGPYQLQAGDQSRIVVANADPVAGDLAELPAAVRGRLEAAGVRVVGEGALGEALWHAARSEWTGPLAWLVLGLGLLEIILTGTFTRARDV